MNHAVAQSGSTLNSDSAAAASGSVITVYLTGIGAVNNAVADGAATPLSPTSTASATSTATIGGASATVQFLGLTPDFAGLAQANILVPALATGDYPLVITAGGYESASAIVSVSGSGTYTSSAAAFRERRVCQQRVQQRRTVQQRGICLRREPDRDGERDGPDQSQRNW